MSTAPAPASSSAAAAADPASAILSTPRDSNHSIDYSTRLYVGNVPFKITKQEIVDHFAKNADESNKFTITTVDILKKRTYNPKTKSYYMRSLGYVFVNLDKESDLDSFISAFNDTDFNGLTIKVRKAVAHESKKEENADEKSDGQKDEPAKKKELTEEQIAAKKEKAAAKRAKKAAAKKEAKENKEAPSASSSSTESSSEDKPKKAKKKSNKKKPSKKEPETTTRAKKPLSEGTVSKNTVYLRNIDFYLTSGDLSKFLNEQTEYHPTWVHIPRRQLPGGQYHYLKKKNIPLKSKGFAFIKFNTEEEQLNFIKEFDGKIINKRQVSATAAVDFDKDKLEEEDEEEKKKEKEEEETIADDAKKVEA